MTTASSSEGVSTSADAKTGGSGLRSVAPMTEAEMLREWNTLCAPRERQERLRRRLEEEREREREILEGKPSTTCSTDTVVTPVPEEELSANPAVVSVATETAAASTLAEAEPVKADAGLVEGESEKQRPEEEPEAAAAAAAAVPSASAAAAVPQPGSPVPVLKQEKSPAPNVKPEMEVNASEEATVAAERTPQGAAQLGLELSEDEQQSEAVGSATVAAGSSGSAESLKRKRRDWEESPIIAARSGLKRKRLHISDDEQVCSYVM